MAFKVRNWAPIAVGMGDTPSMWSYSGPLGDSLADIKSSGYFNGLSDDLQNADFKTGDFIQVVTFNDEFALLVMAVGVGNITTVQIAPHEFPFSFNLISITDGIVPTQAQNGFIFHTSTAALTVDLEDSSQISNGTYYRFINASTGILTIDPNGSQTIDGISSPRVLQPNQSLTITNGITSGGWDTVSDGNIASGAGSGTVTSVAATQPARGITITGSPITTAGVLTFALANDLNALENITGTAFAVRTAAEVWTTREITGIAGQIDVKDGDGIAANPSISIDPTWIGQGAITTVGTITSGTWTGDTIAIANGGTGEVTQQSAINALTNVAPATTFHVLTKNSAGDASWEIPATEKSRFLGLQEFFLVGGSKPGEAIIGASSGAYTFSTGTKEMFANFQIPTDYVSPAPVTILVHWSPADASAGNVVFQVQHANVSPGSAFGAVGTTDTVLQAAPAVVNQYTITTVLTLTGPFVIGDMLTFRFFRDTTDPLDTYGDTAQVHGLFVSYE